MATQAVHDLEALRRLIGAQAPRAESDRTGRDAVRSIGVPILDRLLDGGFPKSALTVLTGVAGAGRMTIAAMLIKEETCARRPGAWIDGKGTLYPPALEQAGVDLSRVLVVRAGDRGVYAMEQVLASGAFGVVIATGLEGTLTTSRLRRLQTATESAGATTLLVLEPESALMVNNAALKLRVARKGQGIQVEVEKHRSSIAGRRAYVAL